MIDKEKLYPILDAYKDNFNKHWIDEVYKWEAIKHFQDNWNIEADNFGEMFKEATSKTYNLLASGYSFPRGMIVNFAEADDDAVRLMFRNLYDESQDLARRVESFMVAAEEIRAKYDDGTWKKHFQNTNAISTYLWLRYPDKYYIYKYELYRNIAKQVSLDFIPKKTSSADVIIEGYKMYDEICGFIKDDDDIKEIIRSSLNDNCYLDPEMKTTTIDIGFYFSRYYKEDLGLTNDSASWFPSIEDYSPGFSVDDWKQLLNDNAVFDDKSLQIMKRFMDYGGQATCKQLSVKYGESFNFYNGGSWALAQRISKKTNCPVMVKDTENSKWWPILYLGKPAGKEVEGAYIWRLRDELSQALDEIDLSDVELYAKPNEDELSKRYWWLTANPKIWSFADIKVGEEISYTLYNENGNKRRIFQNFLDAQVGDIVIGYESNPVKKVVAIGKITQASDGESIRFEKTEVLSTPIEYSSLREYPELEKMEFFIQNNGSLFKLTKGEYDFVKDIIREVNPINPSEEDIQKYTREDFLSKVYMSRERYDVLEALLRNKKNIILQGAPGVGKTFTAKKLAYAMMGEVDDSRIEMVQFHQNYSYEDFIMGYRPEGSDFKLTDGIFYRFCMIASNYPEKDYFFIIDEINRGNMSKIFGELLMLIEKDYRETKATLAYNGMSFSVPKNLYIIGMINTADRSLAMIDYALRRRFSFFEIDPGFSSDGFTNYMKELGNDTFNELIDNIKLLNKEIIKDKSLGKGFQIGHSYFCNVTEKECTDDWMRSVVEFDILPMLSEYWFDEPEKLLHWENKLRGVFDD